MAVILKPGKTYNPNLHGVDMTGDSYYGAIDNPLYNKRNRSCEFAVGIYGCAAFHHQILTPIELVQFTYDGDQFDSVIGNNGITISQAYTLALADPRLVDWQSDE